MPFLRLIIIYIIVIAIAFAIFNRDQVIGLVGLTQETSEVEMGAVDEDEAAEMAKTTPELAVKVQTEEAVIPTESTVEADVEQVTPVTANPSADLKSNLDEVRQAFWRGDVIRAEKLYVGLAAEYGSDANMQGETGNFFYSQRRYGKAAKYFHRAGLLLLKSGNKQQVMSIINMLQAIAPDKATDLRARAAKQP